MTVFSTDCVLSLPVFDHSLKGHFSTLPNVFITKILRYHGYMDLSFEIVFVFLFFGFRFFCFFLYFCRFLYFFSE